MGEIADEIDTLETELSELVNELSAAGHEKAPQGDPPKSGKPRSNQASTSKPRTRVKRPEPQARVSPPVKSVQQRAFAAIENDNRVWSAADLSKVILAPTQQVTTELSKLAKKGSIQRVDKGRYRRNAKRSRSRSSGDADGDGDGDGDVRPARRPPAPARPSDDGSTPTDSWLDDDWLVPKPAAPRLTPVPPGAITRIAPATRRSSGRKPSVTATIPRFGTQYTPGSGSGSIWSDYVNNSAMKPLPWPEQLALFRQLPGLRAACWAEILSSGAYAGKILQHVADVRTKLQVSKGDGTVPAAIRSLVPFVATRISEREQAVVWVGALDIDGRALRSVWEGIQAARAGDSVAWMGDRFLGTQHHAWVDRCAAPMKVLDELRHRLAIMNIGMSRSQARKKFGRGGFDLHDLIQEGYFGLLKAVERFDPDRGFRFSTYAVNWIRHSQSRLIENKGRLVRVPINSQVKACEIIGAADVVGENPEAIANHTGMSQKSVDKALMNLGLIRAAVSLDSSPSGRDGEEVSGLGDRIADEAKSIETLIIEEDQAALLRELVLELPPRQQLIVSQRFGFDGEPKTLREIGEELACSRERVRQIQEYALDNLHALLMARSTTARPSLPSTEGQPSDEPSDPYALGGSHPSPPLRSSFPRRRADPRPASSPDEREAIVAFLAERPGESWSSRELSKALSISHKNVRRVIRVLVHDAAVRIKDKHYTYLGDEDGVDRCILDFLALHPDEHFVPTVLSHELGIAAWAIRTARVRLIKARLVETSGTRRMGFRPPPAANDVPGRVSA